MDGVRVFAHPRLLGAWSSGELALLLLLVIKGQGQSSSDISQANH